MRRPFARSAPTACALMTIRPPARRSASRSVAVHADARHRRRQRRHLEDVVAELVLQVAPDAGRVLLAEHGGQRDALVAGLQVPAQLGGQAVAPARVVEGAREGDRAGVGAPLGHRAQRHRARLVPRAAQVVGQEVGIEVLQRAEARDEDRAGGVGLSQVARQHRHRHDGGRLRRADGGGHQVVRRQVAVEVVARQRRRGRGELLAQPVHAVPDALAADRRVRVALLERLDRLARRLDAVGHVAEDVDRPGPRCVDPTPLASTVTFAPASAQRTATVRPARPAPTTTTSLIAARAPRRAGPGRSSRPGAPGAAGRRRGSATRPSSAPPGSR